MATPATTPSLSDAPPSPSASPTGPGSYPPTSLAAPATLRIALMGNPNTGKTTLFNRLSGLRHKTANFPGTTLEARLGRVRLGPAGTDAAEAEVVDLPGIYSIELDALESRVCRDALAETGIAGAAAMGGGGRAPDAVCVVLDATNLSRNLLLAGETLRRRLPTVVAVNMIDLARRRGLAIDKAAIEAGLGCEAVFVCARSGEGVDELKAALGRARIPSRTPPGDEAGLRAFAEEISAAAASAPDRSAAARADAFTDGLDRVATHPIWGVALFTLVMSGLFYAIFALAAYPMEWIDGLFAGFGDAPGWMPGFLGALYEGGLSGTVKALMPEGYLRDLLSEGVVAGVGATVIFLPQICLLFFLISLLEDTGYLARAAFVVDRWLRPFGLPGHAFVPLLSSHACAIPGIMAARAIPDRRERLATILCAPFMTCSARLPVYVLLTGILFAGRPALAALAFVGCYALGIVAGVGSALLARKTILRGKSRPMALELPTYKMPSLRTALIATVDRAVIFLRKAGTAILAISIALWWLSNFPRTEPPAEAVEIRAVAADIGESEPERAAELESRADSLEATHATANSFAGRIGRTVQPVFEPLGYDWRLTIGVVTSFAAREVFVTTMAVVLTGSEDADDEGIFERMRGATRDDGVTPVFGFATAWSLLVFYVLAMQCLPTLAVTARESGHLKWAVLQLVWMTGLAYLAAMAAFRVASWIGG